MPDSFHVSWTQTRDPELRLFGFPHAGAGPSAYRGWEVGLDPRIEVIALAYPGRETRLQESSCETLESLVELLRREIAPLLDRPYAFFGHSMGALLAYETAVQFRRARLRPPLALFLSGHGLPCPACLETPLAHLDDDEFVLTLSRLTDATGVLFQYPDARELLLPPLRADIAACERYQQHSTPERPLPSPIVAFGGTDDPHVTIDDMRNWQERTAGEFDLKLFPGGHFFLREHRTQVMNVINDVLRPELDRVDCRWASPPDRLTLRHGECHLWLLPCDANSSWVVESPSLSEEESREADSYTHPVLRNRFLLRRAQTRLILSGYLDCRPEEIAVTQGVAGKPELDHSRHPHGIHWNLSHSYDQALLCVMRDREVGIDLEWIRPLADAAVMQQRVLSEREQAERKRLPVSEQRQRFFELWSLKEAVLKAAGTGLSVAPAKVEFVEAPDGFQLTHVPPQLKHARDWTVCPLVPLAGFRGAVAFGPTAAFQDVSDGPIEFRLDPRFQKFDQTPRFCRWSGNQA